MYTRRVNSSWILGRSLLQIFLFITGGLIISHRSPRDLTVETGSVINCRNFCLYLVLLSSVVCSDRVRAYCILQPVKTVVENIVDFLSKKLMFSSMDGDYEIDIHPVLTTSGKCV